VTTAGICAQDRTVCGPPQASIIPLENSETEALEQDIGEPTVMKRNRGLSILS